MLMDTNSALLVWTNLPHATPFLQAVADSQPKFLFGGFGVHGARMDRPMPPELVSHVTEGTNLVYFDWEITGRRLQHVRYLDDTYRIVFDKHGPLLTDAVSLDWIQANLANLAHSTTEIRLADENRLSFARKSTIGLTATEIDFLANWLEQPAFPGGFLTCMATNPTPVVKRKAGTTR